MILHLRGEGGRRAGKSGIKEGGSHGNMISDILL